MKFVIIGAMPMEIKRLRDELGAAEAGRDTYKGYYGKHEIIIACCGIGKVNAAALTQRLIDLHCPNYIINTGIAGALDDRLGLGDIVIGESLLYHDFNPIDILDRCPPFSSIFGTSPRLNLLASDACSSKGYSFYTGRITSGDCFVSSNDKKADILSRTGGLCTEMEGAAIAHVCLLNSVEFTVIRSISDFACDDTEIINDFEEKASDRAAEITKYIIHNI